MRRDFDGPLSALAPHWRSPVQLGGSQRRCGLWTTSTTTAAADAAEVVVILFVVFGGQGQPRARTVRRPRTLPSSMDGWMGLPTTNDDDPVTAPGSRAEPTLTRSCAAFRSTSPPSPLPPPPLRGNGGVATAALAALDR